MENNLCKNCKYFHQHYAFDRRGIFRIYCGHCGLNRVRPKKPDCISCDGFIPASPDEDAFANKEYLSKWVLDYIQKLELLPTIHDEQNI